MTALQGPLSQKLFKCPPVVVPKASSARVIDVSRRRYAAKMAEPPMCSLPKVRAEPHEIFRAPITRILNAVEKVTTVPVAEMKSTRRLRSSYRARQIAMWVASKTTDRSFGEIGACLRRDHSTVMHGISKISSLIDAGDRQTLATLEAVLVILDEEDDANSRTSNP